MCQQILTLKVILLARKQFQEGYRRTMNHFGYSINYTRIFAMREVVPIRQNQIELFILINYFNNGYVQKRRFLDCFVETISTCS